MLLSEHRAFQREIPKQSSFGNSSKPIICRNQQNYSNLESLKKDLNDVISQIGGIEIRSNLENDILIAQEKIRMLKADTRKGYANAPKLMQQRLSQLDNLNKKLQQIQRASNSVLNQIENEPKSLILPEKASDKSGNLVLNSLEALAAYNSMAGKKNSLSNNVANVTEQVSVNEIRNSLDLASKENWDWKKFNKHDALMYSNLRSQLLFGEEKEIISNQINEIDNKILELRQNKSLFSEKTGLNVYSPDSTGRLMSLEAAKMRRENLLTSIINPMIDEKLTQPNIIAQSVKGQPAQFFVIDNRNVPNENEIEQILELNSSYKPVINNLFENGLDFYVVPGHADKDFGDVEGGLCLAENPDAGVWLESYDIEKRFMHMAVKEKALAGLEEIEDFKPSALNDNTDRARALAHELGHVVSFKLMQNDELNDNSSQGLILNASSGDVGFMQGWQLLRAGYKLNEDRIIRNERRYMDDESISNLTSAVEYEMLAEDIRQAVTGDVIQASSKMTGIFDQGEKGKSQFDSVQDYIKACLFDGKKPSEAVFNNMLI